jgi:hypothetical protein
MADAVPDLSQCKKAIKLLKEFARLAKKYGIKLSPQKLKELKDLKDAGTITSGDLPPKLRSIFPGELAGMSLRTIRDKCGKQKERGGHDRA